MWSQHNDSQTLSPLCNTDGAEVGPKEEIESAVDQEYGIRNPRKLLDPKLPSQKEVEEHCLTYLPYRNWCAHCVAGKGRMAPRFKHPDRADGLTEIHVDYCFMLTKGEPLATILAAKERSTKMKMATVVPLKG